MEAWGRMSQSVAGAGVRVGRWGLGSRAWACLGNQGQASGGIKGLKEV